MRRLAEGCGCRFKPRPDVTPCCPIRPAYTSRLVPCARLHPAVGTARDPCPSNPKHTGQEDDNEKLASVRNLRDVAHLLERRPGKPNKQGVNRLTDAGSILQWGN